MMSTGWSMARLAPKALLNAVHNSAVFNRRVRVLSQHLAQAIPHGGRVLDLGCGDGSIALALMGLRPDLEIEGVDVLIRPETHIPVTKFDGSVLPFEDGSFDYVTIVDVLHHTDDPAAVLTEASRVARKGIAIKDHLLEGLGAGPTLRLMDWVGNRGHDVALPYNYLSRSDWEAAFRRAALKVVNWEEKLGLYPAPTGLVFDRHLHFVALMAPERTIAS
jgi:SAM-dependent methyltransferase